MNFHSRLKFLLTGTFYQFNPARLRDLPPDTDEDRFHVSPMSYHRMRYLADYFGADVERVLGDKIKRKILMPLYLACHAIGWPWRRRLYFHKDYADRAERNRAMYAQINSRPVLFSRSLVMVFRETLSERGEPSASPTPRPAPAAATPRASRVRGSRPTPRAASPAAASSPSPSCRSSGATPRPARRSRPRTARDAPGGR